MITPFRLVLAALLCAAALPASADLSAPFNLRCEYRVNPQGIDAARPRLSWNTRSGERAQRQTARQIIVASSAEAAARGEGDLWDSGKTESSDAIQVAYNGAPLAAHQPCWWRVRVWDQDGRESPWSETAFWSMGPLAPEDWAGAKWIGMDGGEAANPKDELVKNARWIWGPGDQPQSGAKPGVCSFRGVITLPESKPVRAFCLMACDNQAKLFVNGERAGDWSQFQIAGEFDATPLLRPGKNIIAVQVENMGDTPNPGGLMLVLRAEYAAGDPVTLHADGSWKTAENAPAGWEKPGFDDTAWAAAQDLGPNGMEPWKEIKTAAARVLPARMLRRGFSVEGPVRRATVTMSGLGLSELHLNGEKIGDEVLSPGCTDYNKRSFCVTRDVTDRIKPGENALGVWLGNGRYYAPRLNEPTTTRTFHFPKLLLVARLEMADGSVRNIVSDESWRITDKGPIRANNEYDGETYDARMEMPGWASPGFDDAAWGAAQVVESPGGVVSAEPAEPIRVTETIHPAALSNPAPGVYVYDMGQNMVGWCRLRVRGPAGTVVRLRHAETLQADGSIYLANIRGAKVTIDYTLKGGAEEVYEPRFTYFGFRYVEMTGFPGEPALDTIEGRVVHDDVENAGAFECSNQLINRIAKNIRWGVRGNYRSMPTDCPQRDERQGWLGDRSEECRGETYLYNISALYAKWVCDMEDSQKDTGSVSDVSPAYWPLYNDNVTWPSSFIIVPGMLYDQYGDTRTLERHYDGMKKWITHMTQYLKDDIMPRDNYGDWCVPPEEQHLIHSKDPMRQTPGDFLGTAYFHFDLKLMARYANLLGKPQDAEEFLALAERLKTAFNKKFLDEKEAKYANGAETTCVLPIAFGLVPEDVRPRLFQRLADSIMVKGNGHLSTGLIGGQWLMRTLSDNGRPDIALTLAAQDSYPSWGYMIGKGATTIWELWNGDTADPAMNSHNHVMLVGDLNLWLYGYLGGIRAAAPGFREILAKPVVPDGLDHVAASHQSPHGQIFSRWEKADGKLRWRLAIPANTTATVHVPAADAAQVTESGMPAAQAPGLEFVEMADGAAVYKAGSGQYLFEAPLVKK